VARLTTACLAACVLVIALSAAPSTATFAGKNGRISFNRVVGNHAEIFSANPDGSDIKQLTTSKPRHAVSFISDWSPDGQTIAFDSDRTDIDGRKKPIQIYLMSANGANVTQLTRGPGFHGEPGWSPTGSRIAIDADWGKHSLNGIWVIPAFDPDGVTVDEAQRVTDVPDRARFDGEPQFSPDGTTIVFTRFKSARRTAIFRVNVDGTGLERLTSYERNASDPDFSPDGRWIAFDTGDSGRPGAKGNIYLMHPDGSEKTALTDNPRFQEGDPFELAQNPVFSPNGRRLLYTQFHDRGTDLVVMHANGSNKRVILGGRRFPNKADWGTHPSG
jgi:Tol biopolymer transport system component